jgi:hypothetical protein
MRDEKEQLKVISGDVQKLSCSVYGVLRTGSPVMFETDPATFLQYGVTIGFECMTESGRALPVAAPAAAAFGTA